MRLFTCKNCSQTVFFENIACEKCGHALGYDAEGQDLVTLDGASGSMLRRGKIGKKFKYCGNAADGACNWLLPLDSTDELCAACRHNRTIPDLTEGENLLSWQAMEFAKHRLFYTLIALGLPLKNINDDPAGGLAFDFLVEYPDGFEKILTGHDDGLITINLNEADDAKREALRTEMGEPYRALLGHFRHEIGHYFWNVLVRDSNRLEACRAVFGDDTLDYAQSLQRHYAEGPPADWQNHFISAYATAHPWEDFAETWAHYLHIVDTLETASSYGLRIHAAATRDPAFHADIRFDPHLASSIDVLMKAWLPLTLAVNSLNRSMGLKDLYPFVVSEPVTKKLGFIHELVHGRVALDTAPHPVGETAQSDS